MATVKGPRLHPSSEKYEHESGKIFAIKSFQIRLYGVLSPLDDFTILHFAKKKRTRLSGNDKGIIEVNYERWRQEHAE